MRLQSQLFDSRVALRVFSLFMLASLVPLLISGWLLSKQVGGALEAQAFDQLAAVTRSYGQISLDKLVVISELLPDPTALARDVDERTAATLGLDAIVRVAGKAEESLLGNWPAPGIDVASDAPLPSLAVLPTPLGYDLVLARRHADTTVFGRVDPGYFWGTDALLGRSMEICVFTPATPTAPMYCSDALPTAGQRALRAAMANAANGQFSWAESNERWLSTYWQLFLPSRFVAEPWTLVVSQPRAAALPWLEAFNRVLPEAAILTFMLIAGLAIAQIRRTLTPLRKLVAGTERIAAQDFTTPVQIASRDEFGELGSAVNAMASQLQHQFASLRALADIDRLILRNAEIEAVIDTLLGQLHALLPQAEHAALLIDANDPDHAHLYRSQRDQPLAIARVSVTGELRRWLATAPSGVAAALTAHAQVLSLGPWPTEAQFSVAPMLTNDNLAGALVAVNPVGLAFTARELDSIHELAARVTVAIAAGEREAELFRRAHFDSLTSLPNRGLLNDRLYQAVAQAQREEHHLAVLFVDLDRFKEINDTFGHHSGDELLKEAGLRLAAVVREADTVARLGGDEYALVLPRVFGPLEAEGVAIKAVEALKRPFLVDGAEVFASASVGVAMFPDDGDSAEELLRKADMAMYSAKDAGKGCYRFFAQQMDQQMQVHHELHQDLRNALFAGEFFLAYQPQSDLRTQRVIAAEALLRWRHPKRGLVSPTLFIPILEETGLINDIGTWVLRKALSDFASWRRLGLPFERVAVNVAAQQLLDANFVDTVFEALVAAGLEGRHLEVELTEESLVSDLRATNAALTRLEKHGVRIALDDFGTGYSSLAYLNELACDTLKIDRAFIINLPAEKSAAIVRAIIAVGKTLGKEVVAEGIENEAQYLQLAGLGCDYGQGFLLGRPLDAAAFVAWARTLEDGRPRAVGDETRLSWRQDIGFQA